MAAQPDYWGDLQPLHVRTPAAILREQAALLGPKTQNLIVAEVDTHVSGSDIVHTFTLRVPALQNYRYGLFAIAHGAESYPVRAGVIRLDSQSELENWLQRQLSSPRTKQIVGNLLAQVNS